MLLMSYYVYMIECLDGTFYTGYTKNLDRRVRLHIKGKGARYTKMHKAKKLVYFEEFASRLYAMRKERKLKKLTHRQKLRLANISSKSTRRGRRQVKAK